MFYAAKLPFDDGGFPSWVPKEAFTYLAHTETGTPIRALAREAGVHASTVLRQVRALEARRRDVLVDRALTRLGAWVQAGSPPDAGGNGGALSEGRLGKEARRVLRRMSAPGAVLAVAAEMDKAVVVRETESGETTRLAVVDREVAEAMALKGWIGCEAPAKISRYHITSGGRAALNRLTAEAENRAARFAEADEPAGEAGTAERPVKETGRGSHAGDTPLTLLARRHDRSGRKFLSPGLVNAGERLREDYEMAGLGRRRGESWDSFLTGAEEEAAAGTPASQAARGRVIGALRDLGPGLGDVVLRCCCYLEGIERTEKQLGWSARSGKVVLRIALQRLRRHYDQLGEAGGLLG